MSVMDDVRAQRAQWAAEERCESVAHASDADSGTSWVRFMGTGVCIIGAFCLIPPITPFGVALLLFGGLCLAFSPTMARAEDNCYQETRRQVSEGSGIGLWAFIRSCLIVAFLIILAGGFAVAVGLAMLQGRGL